MSAVASWTALLNQGHYGTHGVAVMCRVPPRPLADMTVRKSPTSTSVCWEPALPWHEGVWGFCSGRLRVGRSPSMSRSPAATRKQEGGDLLMAEWAQQRMGRGEGLR